MRSQPSAIDQVLRHWPAEWPTRPHEFANLPGFVYVNCDNIFRHLDSYEDASVPMAGCVAPPWPLAVLFWSHRLQANAGTCHSVAVLRAHDPAPDDETFQIHGVVVQHESRGSRGILSGLFSLVLPKDGFLPRAPDGREGIPGYVLGRHHYSTPALRFAATMAITLCGPRALEAAVIGASVSSTWLDDTLRDIQTCLFAFGFANCRNVVQRERGRTNPPKPWQQAGVPTVRYRVLAVDGRATAADDPSEPGDPSAPKRKLSLHIVRGHFARYTPERPLFGKYTGTFWMPQHVRGSPTAGVVVKDYAVGPPALAGAGSAR